MNALAHCMQVNCFSVITANFLSKFEQLNSPSPTCFFCFFPVTKVWIACHSVGNVSASSRVLSNATECNFFVTLLAVEWFFSSMTSLQMIREYKSLETFWATKLSFLHQYKFFHVHTEKDWQQKGSLHWWKRKWLLLFFQECHTTFDVQMPNMAWEMPKITGF